MMDCDYFCYSAEELDNLRCRDHRSHFRFRCSKCHFVSVTSAELGLHSARVHSSFYLPPQQNVEQLFSSTWVNQTECLGIIMFTIIPAMCPCCSSRNWNYLVFQVLTQMGKFIMFITLHSTHLMTFYFSPLTHMPPHRACNGI